MSQGADTFDSSLSTLRRSEKVMATNDASRGDGDDAAAAAAAATSSPPAAASASSSEAAAAQRHLDAGEEALNSLDFGTAAACAAAALEAGGGKEYDARW